ncbi:hypothetical protein LTR78_002226 [Recurvomyces mirabilis]|uniref:Uncharacterized protein n=1 Tax=Recurvomyces mirabilis TaxID=574656 RepID=A0AAE0WU18_9PEZI|nr:hypothetical protein LTR78_002226 [Recurvomyces mirabilis]KAK5160682.1 hypothetical protein LTS14_001694 [Recurvomyces mirabilis]
MSAPLNTTASFSTASSSVYSPTLPPTPGPHHASNISGQPFVLHPTTAYATINCRRGCEQNLRTSGATGAITITMIPIHLIRTIASCRSPVIPKGYGSGKQARTTVSNLTGKPFHLYTTRAATIKLRRKCTQRAGYSAAVANAAQSLNMIPLDLMSVVELFRSPTPFPKPNACRPPMSNLSKQPFHLQTTAVATIKLRRASRMLGPYAGESQYLTMIPHDLIRSVKKASSLSFLNSATKQRIQKRERAEKQHAQGFVEQSAEFEDVTEWLEEVASLGPSPVCKAKEGKKVVGKVACDQEEEFEDFVEWLGAAQRRVEERSLFDDHDDGSGEEVVWCVRDTLL